MALISTYLNLQKTTVPHIYLGYYFFRLKELAVTAGWTVTGSGDGAALYAYSGVTAALAGADQGSGGSYDCWKTGTSGDHTLASAAGEVQNANAWCVLENDGRQLMLCISSQNKSSGYQGYGRMAYVPKGAVKFNGAVATATVTPGAAAKETWLYGERATPEGASMMLANYDGWIHLYADSTAENGVLTLGFVCISTAGSLYEWMCVAPIATGTQAVSDPDPCVVLRNSNPLGPTSKPVATAYNWGSAVMETSQVAGNTASMAFWGNGAVDPVSGTEPYTNAPVVLGAGVNEIYKGEISIKAIAWFALDRGWGHLENDVTNSRVFCTCDGGFAMPWPNTSTVPLP